MIATPPVPQFDTPVISRLGGLTGFSFQLEVSPLVLVVLTMLVGIFVAALSVMLIYHWRRFPFEHDVFRTVERVYVTGVAVLLMIAVAGIFLTT